MKSKLFNYLSKEFNIETKESKDLFLDVSEKENELSLFSEWLIYSSYAWNRISNPGLPANRWKSIFPKWKIYEIIFKNEMKKKEKRVVKKSLATLNCET